ncbi:hypothetical protein GCM10009416_11600 [Craurococcus roseus]|uniref:ParA family protein n=1 Tax=Craurococcus roseus TaxID=77585 RepID=A0ABN1EVE5_9PROT
MAKSTGTTTPAVETAIVASDKGGVGKTLTAHLRVARHQMQNGGRLPVVVEVESEPRLSAIFGADNVKFFPVELDPARLEADPSLAYATWDAVADVVKRSGTTVVLDLGANLVVPFCRYVAEAGDYGPWGKGDAVTFFAVATGESRAVSSARAALFHVRAALPASRRFFTLNQRDERIFPLDVESAGVKEIIAETGATGAIRIPCCTSAAFAPMTDANAQLTEAVKLSPDHWERELGLPGPAAARAAHRLALFLRDGAAAFDAVYGDARADAPAV